jgi:hypothetical protein
VISMLLARISSLSRFFAAFDRAFDAAGEIP